MAVQDGNADSTATTSAIQTTAKSFSFWPTRKDNSHTFTQNPRMTRPSNTENREDRLLEDDEPRTRVCVSGNFGEKCWLRHAGETPKTRAALDEFEALLREKTPHATHIQRDFPDDAESLANSEYFLPFEVCNSTAIWALILAIWVIFASIASYFFFELSPLEMLKGLVACLILTFWDSQTQISASGITHRKFLWRRQFSWDEIERLEARDWFLLAHTSRGAVRLPTLGAFGLRARELFLFLRANGKLNREKRAN